ncbi:MAG: hypothetical protein A2W99_07695 [Bacteroidetes bacterium GWF2_33_16]|nr:MAG: hypothetical protein A2X00_10750 [Bacteroidetes bacterium GWE2_32_14]OFY03658.1 MAG: hypothetical protein A2W99_07695 [Bacteroidetes bacterium GWF2_33_16]
MALKFFHTPKNRQFSFKPRYYDEQKEELENRIKQIKRDLGQSNGIGGEKSYTPNIKGRFRSNLRRTSDANKNSNIRLIIIIIALALIAYYLFFA